MPIDNLSAIYQHIIKRICFEFPFAFDDDGGEHDSDGPVTLHAPVQDIRLLNAFV